MRFALCLVLLLLGAPALAQGVAATPDLRAEVEVAGLTGERFDGTLALLEAEFPSDHRLLAATVEKIDQLSGEEDALLLVAFKQLTELKRKYAGRLRFAPTAAHAAVVGHLALLYDVLFKAEGPAACGRFARDGTAALFELGLAAKYAEPIDEQSVVFFEAVVMAIEDPEPSEAAKPADWETVMQRMIEAGAPPSFAATIGAGDPDDPDLCPALAALLFTISVMDTPEAARARADFAQNLTGY